MTSSLTEGKPLGVLLRFFLPLFLGNLFQQLYLTVDSVIVGRFLGVQGLAAVGSTGSFSYLITGFLIGLCAGACVPAAKSFGARDLAAMRCAMMNAVYLVGALTAVLTVATVFSARTILRMMNTPADILDDAHRYLIVIFGGLAATALYNMSANICRAAGNSRLPLLSLVISSFLNIGLDFLFILVFDWGVTGVAAATILAQLFASLPCLYILFRHMPELRPDREELAVSGKLLGRLAAIGLPTGLQNSFTSIGSIILQGAINGFGTSVVVAVSTGGKLQGIINTPVDSMAVAIGTYSSHNAGAGRIDRIRQGVGQTIFVFSLYSLSTMLVAYFASPAMATWFLSPLETGIIANVTRYLVANCQFTFLLCSLSMLRSSVQGMGFAGSAMLAGVFEMAARILVATVLIERFAYGAICYANPVAWLFANVLLIPVFFLSIRRHRAWSR